LSCRQITSWYSPPIDFMHEMLAQVSRAAVACLFSESWKRE